VAGAVGGAYAGNRVQNSMKKSGQVHRVAVQLDSGETRTLDLHEDPQVSPGDAVRIEDGRLVRR
jgi:outer membrane lipoprotein SlyB